MSNGLAILFVAATQALSAEASRPITKADAVIAIYNQDWGRASAHEPKLVFVAWPDGKVVWSEDPAEGGAPYRTGTVRPERVAAALSRVELDGAFGDKRLAQPCFGPDARFTTVAVKKGALALEMSSWHELAERDGRAVAASCGIRSLPEGKRLEVIRKEPADYLYYRVVWGELRGLAASLMPAESHPVSGDAIKEGGVLSWREAVRR